MVSKFALTFRYWHLSAARVKLYGFKLSLLEYFFLRFEQIGVQMLYCQCSLWIFKLILIKVTLWDNRSNISVSKTQPLQIYLMI